MRFEHNPFYLLFPYVPHFFSLFTIAFENELNSLGLSENFGDVNLVQKIIVSIQVVSINRSTYCLRPVLRNGSQMADCQFLNNRIYAHKAVRLLDR